MILPSMCLLEDTANSWPVFSQEDEQIFDDVTHVGEFIDDFHVREPLPVCAYFVLAFHYQDTRGFQYPERFSRAFEIQL